MMKKEFSWRDIFWTAVTGAVVALLILTVSAGRIAFADDAASGGKIPVICDSDRLVDRLSGSCAAQESAEAVGWKSLFDGKTLEGWHPVGEGKWTVEEGAIVGRANNKELYGLLFSDDTFDDFTVRFKFKVLTGDSGFYIRTIFKERDQAHGNQVQVGLSGSGVGGIYESYGRGWIDKPDDRLQKKILKDGDWNEMVISAKGGDIVVHVNGAKTADLKNDPGRRSGHFALQMHSGNVMHLMFKDIEIRSDDRARFTKFQ